MRMLAAISLMIFVTSMVEAQQAPKSSPPPAVILLRESDFALNTVQGEVTTCPMPTVGIDSAAVAEMQRKRTAQEQAPEVTTPIARSRCANPLAAGSPVLEAELKAFLLPRRGRVRAWEKSQTAP